MSEDPEAREGDDDSQEESRFEQQGDSYDFDRLLEDDEVRDPAARRISDDEIVTLSEPEEMAREQASGDEDPVEDIRASIAAADQPDNPIDRLADRLEEAPTSALVWTGVALFVIFTVLVLVILGGDGQRTAEATPAPAPTVRPPVQGGDPNASAPGSVNSGGTELLVLVGGTSAGNPEFQEQLYTLINNAVRANGVSAQRAVSLRVEDATDSVLANEAQAQELLTAQEAAMVIWMDGDGGAISPRLVVDEELNISPEHRDELGLTLSQLPETTFTFDPANEAEVTTAVNALLGEVAYYAGDYKAAATLFNRATGADISTSSAAPNLQSALQFEAISRYAISGNTPDIAGTALESFSYDPALLLSGLGYQVPTDPQGALAQFTALTQEDPEDVEAWLGRARAHLMLGSYTEAFADADTAADIDPENPNVYIFGGLAAFLLSDNVAALQLFNQAIELENTTQQAYAGRALVYMSSRQYDAALNDFDTAVDLQTNLTRLGRAVAFDQLADTSAALSVYQSFFGKYSGSPGSSAVISVLISSRIDALGAAVEQQQANAAATEAANAAATATQEAVGLQLTAQFEQREAELELELQQQATPEEEE